MECVRCHVGNHWEGAVFCHHCGTRLRNRCVEDGCPAEDLDNAYRFCPLCGKESLFASLGLMDAASSLASGETSEAASERARMAVGGEARGSAVDTTWACGEQGREAVAEKAGEGVEPPESAPRGDTEAKAGSLPDASAVAQTEAAAAPEPGDRENDEGTGNGYVDGRTARLGADAIIAEPPVGSAGEVQALPTD